MKEHFVTISYKFGTVASDGNWLENKVKEYVTDPVVQAIEKTFYDLFIGFLTVTPKMLVVAGIVFFIATMAIGRAKPYAYGLTCWGLSAVLRVIGHEFGIN